MVFAPSGRKLSEQLDRYSVFKVSECLDLNGAFDRIKELFQRLLGFDVDQLVVGKDGEPRPSVALGIGIRVGHCKSNKLFNVHVVTTIGSFDVF